MNEMEVLDPFGRPVKVQVAADVALPRTGDGRDLAVKFIHRTGNPVVIGQGARIMPGTHIYDDVHIGPKVFLGHYVVLQSGTRIGRHTYIGAHVNCEGDTTIER